MEFDKLGKLESNEEKRVMLSDIKNDLIGSLEMKHIYNSNGLIETVLPTFDPLIAEIH